MPFAGFWKQNFDLPKLICGVTDNRIGVRIKHLNNWLSSSTLTSSFVVLYILFEVCPPWVPPRCNPENIFDTPTVNLTHEYIIHTYITYTTNWNFEKRMKKIDMHNNWKIIVQHWHFIKLVFEQINWRCEFNLMKLFLPWHFWKCRLGRPLKDKARGKYAFLV